MRPITTFSIVAYDPDEQAWGVAVASKFLAAGALVSWAQAGTGAVATQSYARVSFGPEGLKLMAGGQSAPEALAQLLANDPKRESRQVGIVDAEGRSAAHTGRDCHDWAGHRIGEGFTCQGNILTGPDTVQAMADAFRGASGELSDRLLAALRAGELAGGDKRGRQSAALLVVRPDGGYGGDNDRYLDLRVDDHETPIKKLEELVSAHHLFFGTPAPDDQMRIDEELARELQALMLRLGYMGGEVDGNWDVVSQQAFMVLVGNENLEERWNLDKSPGMIDRVALEYLRRRFS